MCIIALIPQKKSRKLIFKNSPKVWKRNEKKNTQKIPSCQDAHDDCIAQLSMLVACGELRSWGVEVWIFPLFRIDSGYGIDDGKSYHREKGGTLGMEGP